MGLWVAWNGPIPLPHRGVPAHRLEMHEELVLLGSAYRDRKKGREGEEAAWREG
jgi:hypothetical protein